MASHILLHTNSLLARSSTARSRVTLVCSECKRLKLRCDRKLPCNQCTKRSTLKRCVYAPGAADKIDVQSLHNRTLMLENWKESTQLLLAALEARLPPLALVPPPPPTLPVSYAAGARPTPLDEYNLLWLAALKVPVRALRALDPSLPSSSSTTPAIAKFVSLVKSRKVLAEAAGAWDRAFLPAAYEASSGSGVGMGANSNSNSNSGAARITSFMLTLLPPSTTQSVVLLPALQSVLVLHPICHFQRFQARCRLLETYIAEGQPWADQVRARREQLMLGPAASGGPSSEQGGAGGGGVGEQEEEEEPTLALYAATMAGLAVGALAHRAELRAKGLPIPTTTTTGSAGPQYSQHHQHHQHQHHHPLHPHQQQQQHHHHPGTAPGNSPGITDADPTKLFVVSLKALDRSVLLEPTAGVGGGGGGGGARPSLGTDKVLAGLFQVLFLLCCGELEEGGEGVLDGLREPRLGELLARVMAGVRVAADAVGLLSDPEEVVYRPGSAGMTLWRKEERRRLAAAVVYYDTIVNEILGHPPIVQDVMYTARPPAEVDDRSFSPDILRVEDVPPVGENAAFCSTFFALRTRLMRLVKYGDQVVTYARRKDERDRMMSTVEGLTARMAAHVQQQQQQQQQTPILDAGEEDTQLGHPHHPHYYHLQQPHSQVYQPIPTSDPLPPNSGGAQQQQQQQQQQPHQPQPLGSDGILADFELPPSPQCHLAAQHASAQRTVLKEWLQMLPGYMTLDESKVFAEEVARTHGGISAVVVAAGGGGSTHNSGASAGATGASASAGAGGGAISEKQSPSKAGRMTKNGEACLRHPEMIAQQCELAIMVHSAILRWHLPLLKRETKQWDEHDPDWEPKSEAIWTTLEAAKKLTNALTVQQHVIKAKMPLLISSQAFTRHVFRAGVTFARLAYLASSVPYRQPDDHSSGNGSGCDGDESQDDEDRGVPEWGASVGAGAKEGLVRCVRIYADVERWVRGIDRKTGTSSLPASSSTAAPVAAAAAQQQQQQQPKSAPLRILEALLRKVESGFASDLPSAGSKRKRSEMEEPEVLLQGMAVPYLESYGGLWVIEPASPESDELEHEMLIASEMDVPVTVVGHEEDQPPPSKRFKKNKAKVSEPPAMLTPPERERERERVPGHRSSGNSIFIVRKRDKATTGEASSSDERMVGRRAEAVPQVKVEGSAPIGWETHHQQVAEVPQDIVRVPEDLPIHHPSSAYNPPAAAQAPPPQASTKYYGEHLTPSAAVTPQHVHAVKTHPQLRVDTTTATVAGAVPDPASNIAAPSPAHYPPPHSAVSAPSVPEGWSYHTPQYAVPTPQQAPQYSTPVHYSTPSATAAPAVYAAHPGMHTQQPSPDNFPKTYEPRMQSQHHTPEHQAPASAPAVYDEAQYPTPVAQPVVHMPASRYSVGQSSAGVSPQPVTVYEYSGQPAKAHSIHSHHGHAQGSVPATPQASGYAMSIASGGGYPSQQSMSQEPQMQVIEPQVRTYAPTAQGTWEQPQEYATYQYAQAPYGHPPHPPPMTAPVTMQTHSRYEQNPPPQQPIEVPFTVPSQQWPTNNAPAPYQHPQPYHHPHPY